MSGSSINPKATNTIRVIAVGSSAGGIRSLGIVLAALSAESPPPIVIVQHLAPTSPNALAEILSRHTRLRVKVAAEGEPLRANVAYVAPADKHLVTDEVANGEAHLHLVHTAQVHFSRPSIDRLFLSVASFYGAHAIGLLLSGTGYDGRDGIRAIKRGGGVTMVEDPATAEFSALPRVAVATGDVDFALPVESVGPMLVNLWQRRQ